MGSSKVVALSVLGFLLLSAGASAQERAPTVSESVADGMEVVDPLAFQATAAAWNTFQVQSAKFALSRTKSNEIRELAASLIDKHAEFMPALSVAAQSDQLPSAPVEGMDGRQFGMMGKLEAAPDAQFDTLFLEMQETALTEAIGLFSGFAKSGNGQMKILAAETLPLLQTHLERVSLLLSHADNPS
jgi:putative membrane protein